MTRPAALLLIGVIACLGVSRSIHAQLPAQTVSFSMDVPGGRYSDWVLHAPIGVTGLTGDIVFVELRAKDPWLPAFTVVVEDEGGSVRLSLAQREKRSPLTARLERIDHGDVTTSRDFRGTFARGDSLSFALRWSSNGLVMGIFQGDTIGGVRLSQPTRIQVGTSSGEVNASRLVYLTKASALPD